jgi:hypothetical protein
MVFIIKLRTFFLLAACICCLTNSIIAREQTGKFKVVAFYTGRNDQAHISFLHEANIWFNKMAVDHHFNYDTTTNWNNMNANFLSQYKVVIFLDTRPDSPAQREAFEQYMKNGGAWMGFHFSGFTLTPSDFPQNWNWYHEQFLGAGSYVSNTWRPTSAILRVEDATNPVTKDLPVTFLSSPSEWYRWEHDLRTNPDIDILLAIDSTSFPLGTGPKLDEIWHSGYYPVAWTNKKYKMIYFNFGHNDIDYEHGTNKTLSYTFGNPLQDKLVLNALMWLASAK